jgi:hypothetical protein
MKKLNIIDYFIFIILLVSAIVFFNISSRDNGPERNVLVKVRITQNAGSIYPVAEPGTTYFNSINEPSLITEVRRGDENKPNDLEITVQGKGNLENNRYIFQGLRVLVGQKAELHGDFWAQGIITEIKYAD